MFTFLYRRATKTSFNKLGFFFKISDVHGTNFSGPGPNWTMRKKLGWVSYLTGRPYGPDLWDLWDFNY